jgi:predicted DNA-binding transcriptional regulator YafY
MQKKKVVLPSQIYDLYPEVSTRTLRRDMDVLVELGFVRQEGSTRDTKYILNNHIYA